MMKKTSILDRLLLLATGILAAYQVAVGIEGLGTLAILCYTIAFGVLLIAGLLLIIFGFEILDNPLVVVVAAIIPLSLSLGLVVEYLPTLGTVYQVFVTLGLLVIAVTRYVTPGTIATCRGARHRSPCCCGPTWVRWLRLRSSVRHGPHHRAPSQREDNSPTAILRQHYGKPVETGYVNTPTRFNGFPVSGHEFIRGSFGATPSVFAIG